MRGAKGTGRKQVENRKKGTRATAKNEEPLVSLENMNLARLDQRREPWKKESSGKYGKRVLKNGTLVLGDTKRDQERLREEYNSERGWHVLPGIAEGTKKRGEERRATREKMRRKRERERLEKDAKETSEKRGKVGRAEWRNEGCKNQDEGSSNFDVSSVGALFIKE